MNFGPIKYLVDHMMIPFLSFSYDTIYPNYGIAIILLTVLIKALFFPLMTKQYLSMKGMQAVGPQMTKIKEKYKGNSQKLQQEMMKLYKDNNINPLQGCLPMIIQIPFFLAIYSTVMSPSFKALITEPGVNPGFLPFWLGDLAAPDGTFVLPVLLAIFTYWSQKLIMVDPAQQKFLIMSPILILVFGFKMPSGVLLYWAASTALSTAQQLWVMKKADSPKVKVLGKA